MNSFADEQNLKIQNEYIDDGISGTTFDRPGFQKLISAINSKEINLVLTKDLSRLGRDYIFTGYYLEKFFPENNVRYISVLDGIDTEMDSASNDITPFRAVFNDMYAKDISNKIKSVKHNKQNLGLFIGGKAPFGYKLNKKIPNKLFVDLEAKPIVERIFFEASSGISCRSIAHNLNLDKVPTPSQYAFIHGQKVSKQSNYWSDSRIREILLNEVYIGNMVQGRTKKLNYKSKKNIRLPKKDWKIVKNTHEPLIDLNTFQKASEMIDSRKQTRVKTLDYIIKGCVYCHECRKKMYCSSRHLASGKKYYFRCSTNTSSHNNECSPHSIRMDYVQDFVLNIIKNIIIENYDKSILQQTIIKHLTSPSSKAFYNTTLDEYTKELSKITMDIDKLYSDKNSRHFGS